MKMSTILRRKRFITDKRYQWGITLKIVAICLTGILLHLFMFAFITLRKIDELKWKMHVPVETTGEILRPGLLSGIFSLIITISAIWLVIRHFHIKTAGPVHRIKTDIEKVAGGDLSGSIYLRGNDFFREIENECNALISLLRDRYKTAKDGFAAIEKSIEKMEFVRDMPDAAAAECRQVLDTLAAIRKTIDKL
jgi:methyl-accepting chemotaxis protein